MLVVENLSFSYQNQKILNNISFQIKKGEYLCLLGKNASGKSTLAKLLAGLLSPQEGKILFQGYNPQKQEDSFNIRKSLGIIFQNPEEQIIQSTVFDEIIFGLENIAFPREQMEEKVNQVLEQVALSQYQEAMTFQLSGGEKQRLAIASILAMNPDIFIFDEATSMLDPVGKQQVLKIMKTFHSQGKTILHITHDLEDVLEASQVLLLSEGKIEYQGTPDEFFQRDDLIKKNELELPFLVKIKKLLEKNGTKLETKELKMEDLVKLVYEHIS